jgi:Protein of unknown function (DUF4232)
MAPLLALLVAACGSTPKPASIVPYSAAPVSSEETVPASSVEVTVGVPTSVAPVQVVDSAGTVDEPTEESIDPGLPQCNASQLVALDWEESAAMGHIQLILEVRNISDAACSVALVDRFRAREGANEVVLPMGDPRDMYFDPSPFELSSVLEPGESAYAHFQWYSHVCGDDVPFQVFDSMEMDLGEGGLLRIPDDELFRDQACNLWVSKLLTEKFLL